MIEQFQPYLPLFYEGFEVKFILLCLLSVFLGGFVSVSLIVAGQKWARTFSNITTFLLLPLIGMVITQVISGNIALSLGMVGALSIIRFRHPVKSPLELSIYFLLLTTGIAVTVSPGKAIVLVVFSMAIVYFYGLFKIKFRGYDQFQAYNLNKKDSVEYLLDIVSSNASYELAHAPNLLFSHEDMKRNLFSYQLWFENKQSLDQFYDEGLKSISIEEVKVRCV